MSVIFRQSQITPATEHGAVNELVLRSIEAMVQETDCIRLRGSYSRYDIAMLRIALANFKDELLRDTRLDERFKEKVRELSVDVRVEFRNEPAGFWGRFFTRRAPVQVSERSSVMDAIDEFMDQLISLRFYVQNYFIIPRQRVTMQVVNG